MMGRACGQWLRVDRAGIVAGILIWVAQGDQALRGGESALSQRPATVSRLVVASETILLGRSSLDAGCVLIADDMAAVSGGPSVIVQSLRGQSLEVPRVKIVTVQTSGDLVAADRRAGVPEDDGIPPLIRRQPQVVHDAWRQIAAAVAENERLPQPRPEPLFARAELWMMIGNYDAALRDLLSAMRLASKAGATPRVYDAVFVRLREVLEQYDQTPVPPEDGEPSTHYGHGMHLFWEGRYVEAKKAFDNAISLAPGNPMYWYGRAVARRRLGEEEAARHDALLGAAAERRASSQSDECSREINRALRRLQGSDRLWLEGYRRGDPSRRTMSGMQR